METPLPQSSSTPKAPDGIVIAVRGAVVDVSFAGAELPAIDTALIVDWDRPETLVLEVHSHVDPQTVRAIALQATMGLARQTGVRATRAPVAVPVGDAVLGRLLDVVGTVATMAPRSRRTRLFAVSTKSHPRSRTRPRRPTFSRPASR